MSASPLVCNCGVIILTVFAKFNFAGSVQLLNIIFHQRGPAGLEIFAEVVVGKKKNFTLRPPPIVSPPPPKNPGNKALLAWIIACDLREEEGPAETAQIDDSTKKGFSVFISKIKLNLSAVNWCQKKNLQCSCVTSFKEVTNPEVILLMLHS